MVAALYIRLTRKAPLPSVARPRKVFVARNSTLLTLMSSADTFCAAVLVPDYVKNFQQGPNCAKQ